MDIECALMIKIHWDMLLLLYETKIWNLGHLKHFVIMMCRSKTLIIIEDSSFKT